MQVYCLLNGNFRLYFVIGHFKMKQQIRYLAFLDILGFKDLIENNNLEEVVKLYEKFEPSLLFSIAVANIKYRLEHLDGPLTLPTAEQTHLNSLFISDSIIIWTDDDNPNRFVEIISVVKQHMKLAIELGFPLRGAITCGELAIKTGTHNKSSKLNSYNTILGLPLTKAYLLENTAEWSGCIIDDNTINHYNEQVEFYKKTQSNTLDLNGLIQIDFIKPYKVPMKSGRIKEYYTVNWTHFMGPRLNENVIRKSFNKHNKKTDEWSIENKIRNTINYYRATKKDYDKFVNILEKKNAL